MKTNAQLNSRWRLMRSLVIMLILFFSGSISFRCLPVHFQDDEFSHLADVEPSVTQAQSLAKPTVALSHTPVVWDQWDSHWIISLYRDLSKTCAERFVFSRRCQTKRLKNVSEMRFPLRVLHKIYKVIFFGTDSIVPIVNSWYKYLIQNVHKKKQGAKTFAQHLLYVHVQAPTKLWIIATKKIALRIPGFHTKTRFTVWFVFFWMKPVEPCIVTYQLKVTQSDWSLSKSPGDRTHRVRSWKAGTPWNV